MKVIYRLFGTMKDFQREVGSKLSSKPEFISKESIVEAVNVYFGDKPRILDTRRVLFESFPY